MKYTKLGKSDLQISRICLGCMGFGNPATGQHSWTVDEAQTREIIRHALDLGINFFDTAIVYQNGTSEQDDYAKFKYDKTAEIDGKIHIDRVRSPLPVRA